MEPKLFDYVKAELAKRKGRLPDVCSALPDISYSWISKVATGDILEPSVVKIQRLADYFKTEEHRKNILRR